MRNLCDAAKMSREVAALPFQAHANYGTWSTDFVLCARKIKIDSLTNSKTKPKVKYLMVSLYTVKTALI